MSYDLNILTNKELDEVTFNKLNEQFGLKVYESILALESKSWQILISKESYKVEEEDIPENIIDKVPGLAFGMDISLEPIGASKTAYNKLNSIVKFLTKELNGVGIDDQIGELIIPNNSRGIKLEQPEDKRLSLLTFSWWFDNEFLNEKSDYQNLFKLIETYCPEFLPYRYGLFEPPQHKIEEKGLSHFIDFVWENRNDFTVIYTKKPFYTISLPTHKNSFYNRNGFCPKNIELQVDYRILEKSGWETNLKRFWQKLNGLINPIYSDVCVLDNYSDQRKSVGIDNLTDSHEIRIGWKGIPEQNGLAAFIGEPYKSKLEISKNEFSIDSWGKRKPLKIPEIPNEYRQSRIRIKPDHEDFSFNRFETYYAKEYPFEKPENYKVYEGNPAYNTVYSKQGVPWYKRLFSK